MPEAIGDLSWLGSPQPNKEKAKSEKPKPFVQTPIRGFAISFENAIKFILEGREHPDFPEDPKVGQFLAQSALEALHQDFRLCIYRFTPRLEAAPQIRIVGRAASNQDTTIVFGWNRYHFLPPRDNLRLDSVRSIPKLVVGFFDPIEWGSALQQAEQVVESLERRYILDHPGNLIYADRALGNWIARRLGKGEANIFPPITGINIWTDLDNNPDGAVISLGRGMDFSALNPSRFNPEFDQIAMGIQALSEQVTLEPYKGEKYAQLPKRSIRFDVIKKITGLRLPRRYNPYEIPPPR